MNESYVSMASQGARRQESKPLRGVSARALIPAIIAGVIFLAIMFSVIRGLGWVDAYDNAIENAIISMRSDALTPIFRTLSFIGSSKVLAAIMLVFIVFLLIKKQFKAVLYVIIACGIAVAVCLGIKYGVGRPRPLDFLVDAELVETEPCFPSGHSWNSIMAFSTIFVVLNVYTTNIKRLRGIARLFLVIAIVLPLAIAFSRLYMGEHYPTDVTAGLLGALFFALLFGSWYMRRFTVREEPAPEGEQAWKPYVEQRGSIAWQGTAEARRRAASEQQASDITLVIDPAREQSGKAGQRDSRQSAAKPAQRDARKPAAKPAKKDGTYVGKHAR